MDTLQELHQSMIGNFERLGLSPESAKRAAEGRNGPLFRRIARAARLTGDPPSFKKTPSPRIPSRHELGEDIARRTSALLIEEHGHRLPGDLGGSSAPTELPTLEETRKSMAAHFERLGMSEDAAKRAAQGRNR